MSHINEKTHIPAALSGSGLRRLRTGLRPLHERASPTKGAAHGHHHADQIPGLTVNPGVFHVKSVRVQMHTRRAGPLSRAITLETTRGRRRVWSGVIFSARRPDVRAGSGDPRPMNGGLDGYIENPYSLGFLVFRSIAGSDGFIIIAVWVRNSYAKYDNEMPRAEFHLTLSPPPAA